MRTALVLVLGCAAGCAAAEARPITWGPAVEIARGGGEKGPWQQNHSRFDYVDDPSVALAADGSAAVVWVDQQRKDVLFRVHARDGTPGRTVNVSRSPAIFSWLPRIVLGPERDVYVLWQEIVFSGGSHGGELFFARSRDGGASFEEPVNLSRSVPGDGKGRIDARTWHNGSLDLALAGDGTLYAAWTEYDGPLWLARSTDRGATWSEPSRIDAGSPKPARAPALATDGGTVYLAWTTGEDAGADVRVARASDGRTFGAPVIVERTPGYSDAPKLAVVGGVLHVVYSDASGGPFTPAHVRYTRSRDGARTFEAPRTISRPRGATSATFPSLALDGARVVVAWEAGGEAARGLELAYSSDAGATFSAPSLVEATRDAGTNGSHQGRLMRKLAARDGTIVLVNSALRPGQGSRVWLVRGTLPATRS